MTNKANHQPAEPYARADDEYFLKRLDDLNAHFTKVAAYLEKNKEART